MVSLPSLPEQRLLSKKQAQRYCGCGEVNFRKLIKMRLLPESVPGIVPAKWDRQQLDEAIDRMTKRKIDDAEEKALAAID